MSIFSWITGGAKAVDGVVKTVFGSKHDREQNAAALDAAVQQQYASEFASRPQRTWFDSLIDGLNRLVRPALTCYVCWLVFALPLYDMAVFMDVVTAYSAVPEALWALAGIIITFYFGGRMQYKSLQFKKTDLDKIKEVKKELEYPERPEAQDVETLPWLENPYANR